MKIVQIILCLVWVSLVSAQDQKLTFPQDYFGIYKGDLEITNSRGTQTIQMEFHLQPTDSVGNYNYVLVYIADGKRQERHYNLIETDKEKGRYIVDENNGIILDATVVGNTLYSLFEVQGNILTTIETFFEDRMEFLITFSARKLKRTTGTENSGDVHAYPVTTVQKGVLYKSKT